MSGILHLLDQKRLIAPNGQNIGASIHFYATGTLTPATIYSDAALTTPLTNPVVVAAGGLVPAIYLDPAVTYRRRIVWDAGYLTPDDVDPYQPLSSGQVSFTQSGSGAVERTVQAKLREEISRADYDTWANYLAAIPTGFFSQNGADIHRFGRVMAGDAQRSDLAFPNVERDWFTNFQVAQGFPNGSILSAQIAGITQNQTGSGAAFGGIFASQSLPFTSAGTSSIGAFAFAANNNTTLATNCWGLYVEAHRTSAAVNQAVGIEVDTRATVAGNTPHPWQQGLTIGVQVASGGEFGAGLFDSDVGIQFAKNPDKFKIGINFLHDSITGVSGGTGNGTAIGMAPGHEIVWFNSAGAQQAQIGCTTVSTNGPRLLFEANALRVFSQAGAVGFEVNLVASAVNYLGISNQSTTNPPNIVAFGGDTDIDIQLTPKGTGSVRFGTFTSNADAAVNGYVTIKDAAGNVRKLATIA